MNTKLTILSACLALSVATPAISGDAMNDLEIAHTAYTAGGIDIRYAHLALGISETPEVREFAETMIRDHSAANDAAVALIEKLDVTPQDNELSRALAQGAAAKRGELASLDGHAFDCAYATNELAYHQLVTGHRYVRPSLEALRPAMETICTALARRSNTPLTDAASTEDAPVQNCFLYSAPALNLPDWPNFAPPFGRVLHPCRY